jgi:hypothetical protein
MIEISLKFDVKYVLFVFYILITFLSEDEVEYLQRIRKTDLARNTRQVIRAVQRGKTAIIESHGQPEAAIVDIVDYYLQRAAIHYYTQKPNLDQNSGLTDEAVAILDNEQARYDQVLAHYLGEAISLGRAAELLSLPWVELRMRLLHLNIPILIGPHDTAEFRDEIEALKKWETKNQIK